MVQERVPVDSERRSRAFGRATAWSTLAIGISLALRLATTLIVARNLLPNEFGLILLVATPATIVGYFLEEVLPARMALEEPSRGSEASLRGFALSVAASVTVLVAVLSVSSLVSGEVGALATLVSMPIWLQALNGPSRMRLRRMELNFARFVTVTLPAALGLLLTVVFLATIETKTVAVLAATSIAASAGSIATIVLSGSGCKVASPRRASREDLRYGVAFARSEALTMARTLGDTYFVTAMFGTSSGGSYARAYAMPQTVGSSLVAILRPIAVPASSQLGQEARAAFALRLASGAAAVHLACIAPLILRSGETTEFLYGPNWDTAAQLSPWLSLCAISGAFIAILQTADIAASRLGRASKQNLTLALVTFLALGVGLLLDQLHLACILMSAGFVIVAAGSAVMVAGVRLEVAIVPAAALCLSVAASVGIDSFVAYLLVQAAIALVTALAVKKEVRM